MPLYSQKAFGKFYGVYPHGYWWPNEYGFKGYAIYRRYHGTHGILCIKERYHNAVPRNVPWLNPYQIKFADGVSKWHNLTDIEKEVYNNYSYPGQMSGFNRFLHYYLRDLPY